MNKIDNARAVLKCLWPRQQEIAADAFLDFVASSTAPRLSDSQTQEVLQRLNDDGEKTLTPAELRARIELLP